MARLSVALAILTVVRLSGATSDGTSNYAQRGVHVEYQGNGLPQEATLDGIVTKLDDLTHTIVTNRCVGCQKTLPPLVIAL